MKSKACLELNTLHQPVLLLNINPCSLIVACDICSNRWERAVVSIYPADLSSFTLKSQLQSFLTAAMLQSFTCVLASHCLHFHDDKESVRAWTCFKPPKSTCISVRVTGFVMFCGLIDLNRLKHQHSLLSVWSTCLCSNGCLWLSLSPKANTLMYSL